MPFMGNKKIIKFIYFLGIIRWYNVLLMVLGQYFLALFVFGPQYSFHQIILDKTLHLMVLSTIFTLCGAFVINSFYDSDKDLVNRPKSALVGRAIGTTFLANSYVLFNVLASLFAFCASKKILFFYFFYILICWFYSHKLQKKPIVRELSASLLTMAPLIAVWIHYGVWDWKLMYFFCTLLALLFTKDVVKDIAGHKGNLIFGYNTLVVVAGKSKVKIGLVIFNIVVFLVFLGIYFIQNEHFYKNVDLILGSSITLISTIVVTAIGLTSWKNKYKRMDLMLKFLITFHLALPLFTFFINRIAK
jgi:4-hydroxybenzoate polyprenyltransferase